MSVILTVRPKCMLATSHAGPPPVSSLRQMIDRQTPGHYIMLSAGRSWHNNLMLPNKLTSYQLHI